MLIDIAIFRYYRDIAQHYIVGGECVRGITHFALALPFFNCITHLHLHYHYLHLPYPLFALALPFCTWITHLHLHYPLFALALPIICTCITHLHLNYPFALELPICTCITHLHLHYPFVIFCITHYPSITGINNAHNCIINCKALQHVILGMVLSSNNKWSQHRLLKAHSARDWWLQVFTHFIHAYNTKFHRKASVKDHR